MKRLQCNTAHSQCLQHISAANVLVCNAKLQLSDIARNGAETHHALLGSKGDINQQDSHGVTKALSISVQDLKTAS